MSKTMYALVGQWKMNPSLQKGLSVYRFCPETAAMEKISDHCPHLNVGAQAFDSQRGVVYVADEFWSQQGKTGGGGNLAALQLDAATGQLTLKSLCPTLATNPSFVCIDRTGRYLLVCHHGTENFVTRTLRTQTGWQSLVEYDDCTLLLLRLQEDGSLGEICDVVYFAGQDENGRHRFPHLHTIVPDATGDHYLISDKGLDKWYTFGIDREKGRLVKQSELSTPAHSEPRYGVFHPSLPVFYSNFESEAAVRAYHFEADTGKLNELSVCPALTQPPEAEACPSPSDILIHPKAKSLYISIRGLNLIAVFALDQTGMPTLLQNISCAGADPRSLCITPDGCRLLVTNLGSGAVDAFHISETGALQYDKQVATCGYPANLQIVSL